MARRRANGEGCIYEQADGKWRVLVSMMVGGKRKRVTRIATRKADAVEMLVRLRQEAKNSGFQASGRLTVAGYLAKWLDDCVAHESAANTLASYRNAVEKHLVPRIGDILLKDLNSLHVQNVMAAMVNEEIGGATRKNAHVVLKIAMKRALSFGLIPSNPCANIRRPRHSAKEGQPFTLAESKKLIEKTKGTRFHALMILAFTTGMRQGELLGLEWSKIDFARKTVRIDQQSVEISGKITLSKPKTASSIRTIQLTDYAITALREWKAASMRGGMTVSRMVFPNSDGGVQSRGNFRVRFWNPLLESLGLAHRGFHQVRHTCGSLAIGDGVPITVISKQLGHANVTTTMDIYAHAMETHQAESVLKMDRMFG